MYFPIISSNRLKITFYDERGDQQIAYVPSEELSRDGISLTRNWNVVITKRNGNDLFIMCGATEGSMRIVKKVLGVFGDCSGLKRAPVTLMVSMMQLK
ncbi:hypothetical protein Leryth_017225 [Lithospermum erythrorhizon]|nr:hypothetical protein Leryth_017225 [Lithospermum erythrorhizon]